MQSDGARCVFGRRAGSVGLAVAVAAVLSGPALVQAQCEELLPGTGVPGLSSGVDRLIVWDPDGAGPQGPWLTGVGLVKLAEKTPVQGVATWNGTAWVDLIDYVEGIGYDAMMYQGQLFIAGRFEDQWEQRFGLLRWNGSAFEAVPNAQPDVRTLGEYNGELITYSIGAIQAWNGTQWRTLATTTGTTVRDFAVYNGELIIAGGFTSLAGVAANRVIAWNGSTWHALGAGLSGGSDVMALATHGGDLYATGYFTLSGVTTVNRIAKWNGSTWSAVGTGVGLLPSSIPTVSMRGETLYSDGADLYLGGAFGGVDGVMSDNLARWDGSAWHATDGLAGGWVSAVARYGDEIAVGGSVLGAGSHPAVGLAFYDGDAWRAVASEGITNTVDAATVWNDTLVVSGLFQGAGELRVHGIAAWDGVSWEPLGEGFGRAASCLIPFEGDLVALGNLQTAGGDTVSGAARWDGAAWSPMGALTAGLGMTAVIYNGELYAAGHSAAAGGPADIARWDGSAWVALGSGLSSNATVRALAVYNGELIVGGEFSSAGGEAMSHLAAWNGTSWRNIGLVLALPPAGPVQPGVYTLSVYHGELVVTGHFDSISGSSGYGIAAWNGSTWRGFTPGLPWSQADSRATRVYGGSLYLSVDHAPYLHRWDGSAWSVPLGGTDGRVNGMTEFHGALVPVGAFRLVGGEVSAYWARIIDACPCVVDLTGDGIVDFGDYLEFLNLFDVQDPRVDFTGDGIVDFGDYLEFLNLFDAGC